MNAFDTGDKPFDHSSIAAIPKPESPGPPVHWSSVLLGLVLFLCGGLAGAALTEFRHESRDELPAAPAIPRRLADHLQSKLGLTIEQRDAIEKITREHQVELRRLRRRFFPQFRPLLDSFVQQISDVLSPEQAEQWRKGVRQRIREMGIPEFSDSADAGGKDVKGNP